MRLIIIIVLLSIALLGCIPQDDVNLQRCYWGDFTFCDCEDPATAQEQEICEDYNVQ